MSLTENIWIWSKGTIDLASMPTTTVISGVSYAEISFHDSVSEEFVAIGVTPSLDMVYRDANGNNVTVYSNGEWSYSKYRTIIFNENGSMQFENWFRKNATYRPNDLTNTTWKIREEIMGLGTGNYSINFTSNNTNYRRLYPVNEQTIRYNASTWGSGTIVYQYGQWLNQNHRTIHITGGTDVTNESLILWLVNSADLIIPEYTITYNAIHGTRPSKTVLEHYYLEPDDLTPMPDVEGYHFLGWDKEEGYEITQNTTINAQWEATPQLIIHFNFSGVPDFIRDIPYTLTVEDLPIPTRSGYRFVDWTIEGQPISEQLPYTFEEAVEGTLEPSWIRQRIITYSTAHGAAPASKTVDNGHALTQEDLPTLDDIQGWHFTGWDKSEGYVVNANITITAQWQQVTTRTITYNMGGHGTQIPPQYVIDGQKATRPTDPTATGYRFDNWYTESTYTNIFDFDTPITADRTLYAKWIQLQRYEVTYENDKGETPDDFYFYETHTLTAEELPTYTDEDFIFAGWFDGDVRKLPDDVLTSDTNLVAHWVEKPQPYVEPEPDYNGNRHNEKYTFYRVSGDNWQEHETYNYITGGSVEYSTSTKLKVTAEFEFDGYELPNVNDLIRVYYSFTDDEGVLSKDAIATLLVSFAEKNLIDTIKGVETSGKLDGLSVLSILLNAKVGRPYTIKKNSNAVFEAEKICREFGLQVNAEPSSFSLTSDHTFVGGTDYLEIVNWCLTSASFSEAYPDAMGVVQMVSNLSIQNKEESYVFENDSRSIILPEVSEINDWQNAPNVVRLLYNLDDACISSYAKNISGSRASLENRGNREITYFEEVSDLGVGDKRQSMKNLAETMLMEKSADVEYATIQHAYVPICINDVIKIKYADYEWTGNVDNMSIELAPSTETETKIKRTLSNEIYIESGAEVLR